MKEIFEIIVEDIILMFHVRMPYGVRFLMR